jgi:cellulose synthase/poly-beta-1,6-N-acetylglucosamine synthase-like glycosyltransferase
MTAIEIVSLINDGLFLIALIGLTAMVLGFLRLIVLHRRLRPAAMDREAALLASELPADAELPHVLIQLPTFNEGPIVTRVLEAAAALDWPADKLHIQSLDDSTDGTTAIAREAVAAIAARGIDAELIHREDRAGFKAGALQFGIEKAPHPFVAILDVDYVPAPDFLKQCMKALLAEEKLAFAQARFDFLNGEENWLTRAQVLMLDTHLAIEQATRSWSGQVLPFNGTCGVWRRAAIVDAGGWQGDTLAEDMDLSYRAHLKGWHAEFLVSVPVLGELPTTVASWTLQQKRWSKGFAQVAKKMLPRLKGSGFNATQMRGALIHLLAWWAIPLFGLAAVTGIVGLFLQADSMPYMVAVLILALAIGEGTHLFGTWTANRLLRRWSVPKFLFVFLSVPVLMVLSTLSNIRGVIEAKLGRASEFARTPKRGVTDAGS